LIDVNQEQEKKNNLCDMPLVIPYRKRGRLRSSMSPSETAKLIQMKAQLEQQIKALEEQINLEKIALTVSNWSQQRFNTLRYKDRPDFASIFSFTYDQTMGVNSKGFFYSNMCSGVLVLANVTRGTSAQKKNA